MRKSPDKEFEQSVFQVYLSSYKKFKYWFAIFYFLVIVFSLILYNEEMSEAFKIYKPLDKFVEERDLYSFVLDPDNNISKENIRKKILQHLSIIKIENGNWLKGTQQNQAFQIKARSMKADTINFYSDSIFTAFIDSFKTTYLYSDSLSIVDTIAYYDSLINLDTLKYGKSWKKRQPYRDEVKSKFRASINENQDQEIRSVVPIDEITSYIYSKTVLSDTALNNMPIKVLQEKANEILPKVSDYIKEDKISPQNFKVPLNLEMATDYLLLILVIIALFLQFHFVNYKFYEKQFIGNKRELIRVPAITNIIDNLKMPGLSVRFIYKPMQCLSYVFNLIAPIVAMLMIALQLLNISYNYTWFVVMSL